MNLGMRMLRLSAAALLLFAFVACDSDSGGDDGNVTGDTGTVSGAVTAADGGDAVVGATVTAEPGAETATTGDDGSYSLELAAGTYTVTITADGYVAKTREDVTVVAGETLTLDFALTAGADAGSITGLVTDAATGDPIEGATVATDPETTTATTGADGAYELVGVPAGTYTVNVTADGYVAGSAADVAVEAGQAAAADVALEVGGAQAVVTVQNDCVDAVIADAEIVADGGAPVLTDAEGQATIELTPGEHTLTVDAAGFIPSSITIDVTAGTPADETVGLLCQHYAVAETARNFLADVTAETDPWMPFIGAQDLFDNMNDGDDSNDPTVLSVRKGEHYDIGHIPGAVNIPWKQVAEPESLETLGDPADQWLTAYCYTGHTGGIATGVLNLLGYRTKNLLHGMMSWTKDEDVRVISPFNADAEHDFPVETDANVADGDYDPPVLDFDGVETEKDVVRAAASAYLNREGMAATMSAQDLFDLLNDGDDANDPFIISVRSPDDYAKGHVPGAVNIPWTKIALEENLRKIPTDRKIVVYCYTGHSGAIATAILGTLGYDASDLKFGMMSWTMDETVRVKSPFTEDATAHDFPLEP